MRNPIFILFFLLISNYSFGQHSKEHPNEIDPYSGPHELFVVQGNYIGFFRTIDTDTSDYTILTKLFRLKCISASDFFVLSNLDSISLKVMKQPFVFSVDSVKIIETTDNKCLFYFAMNNIFQGSATVASQEISFELTFHVTNLTDLKTFNLTNIKFLKTRKY